MNPYRERQPRYCMKAKLLKLFAVLLISFGISPIHAQSESSYQKVAELTAESLNSRTAEKLFPYFSDDFSIAGQSGPVAKMVFKQLCLQLGDSIHRIEKKGMIAEAAQTRVIYTFHYDQKGPTETKFIFNKSGLLEGLELFEMEVKHANKQAELSKPSSSDVRIPFTMAGKLILTKVHVNGQLKHFLLDSGSPKVILNAAYFSVEDDGRKTISSTKGVGGAVSGMNLIKIKSLGWYGIEIANQELLTLDLSHLEKELETEIHGLIGYEMFSSYDVFFNYADKELLLLEPESSTAFLESHFPDAKTSSQTFALGHHIPILDATIDEQVLKLGLDSGAESNLLSSSLFETVKESLDNIRTDELVGIGNNPSDVTKAAIKRLEMGGKIFEQTATVFSDISHIADGYQLKLDGLVGYEILSKQKTLLSFKRKELTFIY
ncbi:MAG: hypothetical protein ACRBF0_20055 [Calditrichia bacterium]